MKVISKLCLLSLVFLSCQFLIGQNDTIKSDRMIIVKQYSPTVNDAFKIKQNPSLKDTISQQRKSLEYEFVDVPVASTFTPAKGQASGVKRTQRPRYFNNYAKVGFGNYTTILAEFFGQLNIDRGKNLDISLSHLSSQGGIEDVVLDDHFSDSELGLNFTSEQRNFIWNSGIEISHRQYNYYGLPNVDDFSDTQISEIDPQQTYLGLKLLGGINFYNGILDKVDLSFQNFSDDFSSAEQRLDIQPQFELPLAQQLLKANLKLDFLNGKFENRFDDTENSINYQYLQMSLNPFMSFKIEDLNLKIGTELVYNSDLENSESDFFIYPDLRADLKLNDGAQNVFVGVDGGLEQNTYANFSEINPFVSPTLFVAPSNNMFDAFAGFNTKLLDNLFFSTQINYASTENYALFKNNPRVFTAQEIEAYENGNSFGVVYDDIDVISFSGEINYEIEDLDLGLFAKYSNYSTDFEAEAWNLPNIELKAFGHYNFTEKWRFGGSLFFVGERNAFLSPEDVKTLKSFVDLNLSAEYAINKRLSAFVNGNNLLGNSYERWQNFDVQGIQVLGGLIYQFDW
ncbi:TonB-dependent receptor [Psychroflexus aestuariivivens]|uniref:TonB-dependent receptor n=1 Tax=Psychroflexus aestuariivivens TaxID=1795040 RepID=UPI000FDB4204|nr:TonB-dependent receptor [Psychroflexus aestuariivivens]